MRISICLDIEGKFLIRPTTHKPSARPLLAHCSAVHCIVTVLGGEEGFTVKKGYFLRVQTILGKYFFLHICSFKNPLGLEGNIVTAVTAAYDRLLLLVTSPPFMTMLVVSW